MTYYNENDPKTAAWLRDLIKEGHIPAGYVDERTILDVKPHELTTYAQQHFFAGIGGWAFALRLAGWPDERPVRTGSCPCQPFSQSGKQLGTKDERHLWPVFRDLITFGESSITFGEQVASPLGREWLAGVRADLEGLGYEVGAADLCAAGVGSPNIRQRLFWVANAERAERRAFITGNVSHGNEERKETAGRLAACGASNGVGDTYQPRSQGWNERIIECPYQWPIGTPNLVVRCQDGKARRFEPGSFPLADGVPGRVGLLRGYGNAINPWLAAEFIQASVEAIESTR